MSPTTMSLPFGPRPSISSDIAFELGAVARMTCAPPSFCSSSASFVDLRAPVDVEYVPVIPRVVAGFLGPVVEVVLVTASPDHPVYAGTSPDGLAHGLGDRAVVDARAAFGCEVPVKFAALIEEPSFGDQDAGLQIPAARFEQQHLRILVFS